MSQETKLQLSAFIDGELDASSGRFLLRRLQRDQELADCWERWHLARDCLQRQRVMPLRDDFADRVAAALQAEAAPAGRSGSWARWAGGLAVAASVTFAALLAMPSPTGTPVAPGAAVATTSPAPASSVATAPANPIGVDSQVVPSGIDNGLLQPSLGGVAETVSARSHPHSMQLDPRIEALLLRHNGVLRDASQPALMPFIPVAAPRQPWSMLPPTGNESAR